MKSVEPVLSLVPQCKGLRIARIVETSNAESPTMMYRYNYPTWQWIKVYQKPVRAVYNTSHRTFPLLCS